MSLRKAILEWISYGYDEDSIDDLDAEDQRALSFDVYTAEQDFLQDAISEAIGTNPGYRAEILLAYKQADFVQIGAVIDRILRHYLIGSKWLKTEFREASEQERMWDGDE